MNLKEYLDGLRGGTLKPAGPTQPRKEKLPPKKTRNWRKFRCKNGHISKVETVRSFVACVDGRCFLRAYPEDSDE